jgi:hypothetical protein
MAMVFTGCYEVHQGHYKATKVAGWTSWDAGGCNFFEFPTQHTPNWMIQLGGAEIGKLHIRIYSQAYDPFGMWKSNLLSFSGKPIRILFVDENNREITIAADGFETLYGQDLEVGNSKDFTVIVPAFKIGDNTVPELSAHLHWTDKKYRVWGPVQ